MMASKNEMGYMGGGRKLKTGPHGSGTVPAEPAAPKVSVTVKDVRVTGELTPATVQKALEDEFGEADAVLSGRRQGGCERRRSSH